MHSVCDNYEQAVITRAALCFLMQPVQYSHVHILKIDNGETKTRTRINFDYRLASFDLSVLYKIQAKRNNPVA